MQDTYTPATLSTVPTNGTKFLNACTLINKVQLISSQNSQLNEAERTKNSRFKRTAEKF